MTKIQYYTCEKTGKIYLEMNDSRSVRVGYDSIDSFDSVLQNTQQCGTGYDTFPKSMKVPLPDAFEILNGITN